MKSHLSKHEVITFVQDKKFILRVGVQNLFCGLECKIYFAGWVGLNVILRVADQYGGQHKHVTHPTGKWWAT